MVCSLVHAHDPCTGIPNSPSRERIGMLGRFDRPGRDGGNKAPIDPDIPRVREAGNNRVEALCEAQGTTRNSVKRGNPRGTSVDAYAGFENGSRSQSSPLGAWGRWRLVQVLSTYYNE